MKKLFLSTFIMLFITGMVHAQWNTDLTTNNMNNTNTGNVGVGTSNLSAKFTIYQTSALGAAAKNNILLSATGGPTINNFRNNVWLVRNAAGSDWFTARLHDGISVDLSFLTPQTDTRTWWERDAYQDIQSWGTAANTYLTINKGKVGVGTTSPRSSLDIWGGILYVTGADLVGTTYVSANQGYAYFCNNTLGNGLAISPSGSVGIGTTAPDSKLSVNGTIHSREVKNRSERME
jgi:hypothetical protein